MSMPPVASTARRRRVDVNGINGIHASRTLPEYSGVGGTAGMSNGHTNGLSSHATIAGGISGSGNHYPPSNPAVGDDSKLATHPSGLRSLLHPRLAVVLGVPRRWHPFLVIWRLFSIGPAIYWGLPSVARLLALVHLKYIVQFGAGGAGVAGGNADSSAQSSPVAATAANTGAPAMSATYDWTSSDFQLRFTEAWMTVLWCFASGWVSFYLTDTLMSRALLNYTPLATIFRLSVINLVNVLFNSSVLGQFAAPADPRFAFAPWIVIASVLTLVYNIAQRGIRIHKDYALSMSIFSIASYVSMVALLWHMYVDRAAEYPDIPLVRNLRLGCQGLEELAVKIMDYGNVNMAGATNTFRPIP
ncbi:N-glycosylation protein eos1 [Rhypophila sp. PSN 637]